MAESARFVSYTVNSFSVQRIGNPMVGMLCVGMVSFCKAQQWSNNLAGDSADATYRRGNDCMCQLCLLCEQNFFNDIELTNRDTQAISAIERPRYEYTKRRCIPECSTFREGKDPMAWHFAYLWRLITYVSMYVSRGIKPSHVLAKRPRLCCCTLWC